MIYRFREGGLATSFLWNLNSSSLWLPHRLSSQISANQHEAETSANANKHSNTRAKGNDVSHRLFQCRHSTSRDVVASSPSFSRPAAKAARRACSQAKDFVKLKFLGSTDSQIFSPIVLHCERFARTSAQL